jgi:homocysteine S-methyltransferase
MPDPFLAALNDKPLLADGAMGTLLYTRGVNPETCFEQLNLSKPELIQQVHVDYLNAGADVIETNSFSGNRFKLAAFGLEDQVWKLNVAAAKAAKTARDIAGAPAFIAGAVGPTGKLFAHLGGVSEGEVSEAFKAQMEALLAGGVDLFVIETMSSLEETILAIRAARQVARLPIVAQLSFSVEGHTLMGVTPEEAANLLFGDPGQSPDVLGINCGAGPGPVFDSLLRLNAAARAHTGTDRLESKKIFLSCLPNAGQPSLSGGRYQFMSSPDYCASYVEPYIRAGARLIGGCCGTTPQHIQAMRSSIDHLLKTIDPGDLSSSLTAPADHKPIQVSIGHSNGSLRNSESHVGAQEQKQQGVEDSALPALSARLQTMKALPGSGENFFISVELDPPKGPIARRILQAAQALKLAGADAINVGDSPMARVRMSSLAACQLINQSAGIETIIHFTTRDRNLMGIQADLLGCQALGVKNILALTGDPPSLGNYVHATAVYDVDSVGLIKIITKLNEGKDIAGNSIGSATQLSIGCAVNPTSKNRQEEIERFKQKLDAGAHFAMTQPVYQASDLTDFLEEFGPCPVPILVGVMPLHSFKHAEYLHNEVPGISIPDKIRQAMQNAGEAGSALGMSLAEQLLEELMPDCQGTYLVPSFGKYDEMCSLIKSLRQIKVEIA